MKSVEIIVLYWANDVYWYVFIHKCSSILRCLVPLPCVSILLFYWNRCAQLISNKNANGIYLGSWNLTGILRKTRGNCCLSCSYVALGKSTRQVFDTGLSDLFHTWSQNRSNMMKLVSVLFQANGKSSQTSVIYSTVWSIPPLTTEQVRHEETVCHISSYWQK